MTYTAFGPGISSSSSPSSSLVTGDGARLGAGGVLGLEGIHRRDDRGDRDRDLFRKFS